ncbi:unnamed protein product [Bemisia tabaci]|uniref:Ubiquitin carboxyl-terminal hydrolase n=1 Tax=Bemisia tabaci TaxID=7038 RepID=A0A9P0A1D1_BEMTA|nr:unnamed protein product [Bemisia tabaci]
MPQYKVKVKWGKELYKDVDVNTDLEPMVFKAQLYALTGVQPARQKVMLKGQTLKDNDWGNIQITNGGTILLMGSKDDVPAEPDVKPVFVEDMNDAELASASNLPAGLNNLGNTCYLNAVVQCLKSVPELRSALKQYEGAVVLAGAPSQSITAALRDLYQVMDKGHNIPPILLLQVLHIAFPRFAEKSESGSYVQQDAYECWTELVRMLQQKLPSKPNKDDSPITFKSFVEQYFGGSFDVEFKCTEADEPPSTSTENFLELSCFISQDVKYMMAGLQSKMQEQLTKNSPTLGRDAVYTKTCKIRRLPAYLTVQFVRYVYKEKDKVNAKILKDIKFPYDFDTYELCSPELQKKLEPMRQKFKEFEDKQALEATSGTGKKPIEKKKDVKYEPYWFEDDLGSNNSGYYTLQAVLTHKGRLSSSGHYVAWVRSPSNPSMWIKFDDDVVTPITLEEVLKLSGGGDWHTAYVLLYGPRQLEIPESSEIKIEPSDKNGTNQSTPTS